GMTGSTVLGSTRSIVDPGLLGRLLAFTLFHEPFHGVHHKYARLPHAALPEFTDDLEPAGPPELPPFLTYRQALLDRLPSLLDPKVGSQWLKERDEGGMRDEISNPKSEIRNEFKAQNPTSQINRAGRVLIAIGCAIVSVPFAAAADREEASPPKTRIAIV